MSASNLTVAAAPPAGFVRRGAATLLDAVVLFVGYLLIAVSVGTLFSLSVTTLGGIFYLLPLLYFPYAWSRFGEGQTFGKRGLDIEVVDSDGNYISLWRSIGRFLIYTLSAIPLGLGFWWALWDREHRTWHDKVAGTYVRRVDYRPPTQRKQDSAVPPPVSRALCPWCGESIATSARVCRYCGMQLGQHWAD